MTEEIKESPTLPEPEEIKEPLNEKDALLRALDELGVDSVDRLEGIHRASAQAGNLSNIVGDLRRQNEELKKLIENTQRQPEQYYDETPVNIKNEVKTVLSEFWAEQQKLQYETNKKVLTELNKARQSRHYKNIPAVKEIFEMKLNDIETQSRMGEGVLTPSDLLNEIALTYYEKVARSSVDTTDKLKSASRLNPPHMESSESGPVEQEPDSIKENIKKVRKNWKGSESDIESLVDAMFPKGDAILRID